VHSTLFTLSDLFFHTFSLFIAMLMLTGCSQHGDSDLKISSSPIAMEWNLVSNFEPDNKHRAALTLINTGQTPLPADGWTLYFNSVRMLDPESFPKEYRVSHINGYFFKLEPTESSTSIEPGERTEIEYLANYFAIKASDAPEGFYFVFNDGSIKDVDSVTVQPFTGNEQHHRSPNDNIPIPDPEFTFTENSRLELLDEGQLESITPTPAEQDLAEGTYRFPDPLTIAFDSHFTREARFLADAVSRELGIETRMVSESGSESVDDVLFTRTDQRFTSQEAYAIDISPERITLSADEPAGAFYAVQSLRALIANRPGEAPDIRSRSITDQPAFAYRGMHLDVSRNFQPAESVKRLLDIMALYKLNRFHFHLTDDEGWRLEIDSLPELTEVGGRRGHTETEENYLFPVYGSGPDPAPEASMGSGWYTREEYIDILQYAAERHIEVIPEIDVPGHARAAIIAMRARANRLMAEGDTAAANRYRLDEPEDSSSYQSVQHYTDNVINVCQESTYRFMNVVIDDVIAMHADAGVPLNMIHMGGDEVPHGAWEQSPACDDLLATADIGSVGQLPSYFFGRMIDKLASEGIKMGGWEEVALRENEEGSAEINPEFAGRAVPYVWSNIWGGGTEDRAYRLANQGYKVVMSHASNFYFDFAYNKHWQEPGFYWAAMFNTEAPFSFIPFNLFKNATRDSYGNPLPDDYFDDMAQLREQSTSNILGLQGQLWSETVNEPGRMEYMILPRLLGLAERAWTGQPGWSRYADAGRMEQERVAAWNEFAHRIGTLEMPRLDRLYEEIGYRIPAPGAVVSNDTLRANISLPGFVIRYETNGQEPAPDSPEYTGPVKLSPGDRVQLAAFSTTGRSGRSVVVEN